ncbi:hypothetical protein pb186bvf_011078 [Paramecium bursaria]
MELLSSEEKKILQRYNEQLQIRQFNHSVPLYSEVLEGKHRQRVETPQQQQSRNTEKLRVIQQSSPQQKEKFKDLLQEFSQIQNKCAENIFKFGTLIENKSDYKEEQPIKQKKQMAKSSQSSYSLTYNEKLIEQVERLVSMKSIDNKFLLRVVKKHVNECPQFAKLLKSELQNTLSKIK